MNSKDVIHSGDTLAYGNQTLTMIDFKELEALKDDRVKLLVLVVILVALLAVVCFKWLNEREKNVAARAMIRTQEMMITNLMPPPAVPRGIPLGTALVNARTGETIAGNMNMPGGA